jgi:Holliday junction resolvasome RuvABC endonuclease subunit
MNLLALDQSTNKSGFVVMDANKKIITFGIIDLSSLPKSTDQDQAEKRYQFISQMRELVYKYDITIIVTEGVYFHKNPDTLRKLACMQGTIQDWCRNNSVLCFSFANAGEWRKLLSIKSQNRDEYKEATKQYVISMYGLPDNLAEDVYDAVGIGTAYFRLLELKKIE